MSEINKSEITRRTFLDWVIKGGLLVALFGLLYPAFRYILPVSRRGPSGGLEEVAGVEDIPVWGSKKVIVGGSSVLVVRTSDGFKAYSATCTHLGCLVDWVGDKREIICPCHAGVFDMEGRKVSGPPPTSLPMYAVSVVNNKVFVKLHA